MLLSFLRREPPQRAQVGLAVALGQPAALVRGDELGLSRLLLGRFAGVEILFVLFLDGGQLVGNGLFMVQQTVHRLAELGLDRGEILGTDGTGLVQLRL